MQQWAKGYANAQKSLDKIWLPSDAAPDTLKFWPDAFRSHLDRIMNCAFSPTINIFPRFAKVDNLAGRDRQQALTSPAPWACRSGCLLETPGAVSAAVMKMSVPRTALPSHRPSCRPTTMCTACVSGGGQSTAPREASPERTFSSPRTVDLDGFSVSCRKVQIQLDMHLGTYGRNISDMDVMDARQVKVSRANCLSSEQTVHSLSVGQALVFILFQPSSAPYTSLARFSSVDILSETDLCGTRPSHFTDG